MVTATEILTARCLDCQLLLVTSDVTYIFLLRPRKQIYKKSLFVDPPEFGQLRKV